MDRGADAMTGRGDGGGGTLVHTACLLGRATFIELLVKRCGLEIATRNQENKHPVEIVAATGDVDTMRAVLALGAELVPSVLPTAAARQRLELIK